MTSNPKPGQFEPEYENDISVKNPYRVILFNDAWHSFDEVIDQIVKAIQCSFDKAREFAFEAHVKGKAEVYKGDLNKCLKVSAILEEIALNTQIVS
jgi:ATP-dependent Clp protease adapter protein ClpS